MEEKLYNVFHKPESDWIIKIFEDNLAVVTQINKESSFKMNQKYYL